MAFNRLVWGGQGEINSDGAQMPSLCGQPVHVLGEGVPLMAQRPGRRADRSHDPRLRVIRGLARGPAPTFLIGSGHLGGRMAVYYQGQRSSPPVVEPSSALPGAVYASAGRTSSVQQTGLFALSPLYNPL